MQTKNILLKQKSYQLAKDFIKFNSKCHSPYHAVSEIEKILKENQFLRLFENEPFNLKPGCRYYLKRGFDSSIIIFDIPKNFDLNSLFFKMIATHVDSPCIRVAPKSKKEFKSMEQCCIQTYGGGLWHTWFDRDLLLAGRVVIKEKNKLNKKLFTSPYPVANIPNLAIHLRKERNTFSPDKEIELRPIIAQKLEELIDEKVELTKEDINKKNGHSLKLLKLISSELKCNIEDIIDFDLCFADANPPNLFGLDQEFISSPRLDNLFSVYFSLRGYLDNLNNCTNNNGLNILMMFDHEEIGSNTYVGADSSYINTLLNRIITNLQSVSKQYNHNLLYQILARSYLVSADMAHGVHPNYINNHQCNHQVEINKGVVLKINCNGRYITDSVSSSIIKSICGSINVPIQEFIVPQNSPCGSTVGPMLASKLGCLGIDVGISQFSMHSIRETCGVIDTFYYSEFFKALCNASIKDLSIFEN